MWLWRIIWCVMDTAFIIGNGESRTIFPIESLKDSGIVYGCNAIYRDLPDICNHIVAVNPPMYEELKNWYVQTKPNLKIHGPDDISDWNYILPSDNNENETPDGLKLYRIWRGGDKNGNKIRTIDFSTCRGSGMSAILLAAESDVKNVVIVAFDILGSRQWEFDDGTQSRTQNNIYKDSQHYPSRINMKAYLKYEWMYQMRQIIRKFPSTNFYFINRKENIFANHFLPHYFSVGSSEGGTKRQIQNIKVGTYADLKRWLEGQKDSINWIKL